jgi:hypothetical protein
MAKVKVGGTDGLIDQLLTLVRWSASTDINSAQRKRALKILDTCEKSISQYDALVHLTRRSTVTINTGASSASLPTNPPIDFGKDFTVLHGSGKGRIDVLPPSEFNPLFGNADLAASAGATQAYLAIDPADGTMKLWFDWTNPGANLDFTIIFQQAVIDLVDGTAASNVSLLPEGYELTLLLPKAEAYIKTRRNDPAAKSLEAEVDRQVELFYSKFRANKDAAVTDRNAVSDASIPPQGEKPMERR